jgi:hypothetical protein
LKNNHGLVARQSMFAIAAQHDRHDANQQNEPDYLSQILTSGDFPTETNAHKM